MPDQPDDARKRQQRGVFPPFFAPRNGRGESSPTPPGSGSWRRVSRLFTPPEGTRQRRTPAAPQAPFTPSQTPPAMPAATSPLSPYVGPPAEAASEVSAGITENIEAQLQADQEALAEPELSVPEALAEQPVDASGAYASDAGVPEAELPRAELSELELAEAELAEADAVDAHLPFPPSLELAGATEDLARFDPMAFDEEADRFVVESLEPEPITLAPGELERLDVEVDSLDAMVRGGDLALDESVVAANIPHDAIESIERYLADDVETRLAEDAGAVPPAASAALDEVVGTGDVLATTSDAAPVAGGLGAAPAEAGEADPWAGAELLEPAFGSIGWPSSEIAALAAEGPGDGVDEMSAALAWNDGEDAGTTIEHVPVVADASGADDSSVGDALSAMAHELRDSSSAWANEGDARARDDADLSARARFYGGADPSVAPAELEVSGEGSVYASELAAAEAAGRAAADAGGDAGAAIADALARVAARIRAGEVELPPEAVGASDESALAAALAALLRGPRR